MRVTARAATAALAALLISTAASATTTMGSAEAAPADDEQTFTEVLTELATNALEELTRLTLEASAFLADISADDSDAISTEIGPEAEEAGTPASSLGEAERVAPVPFIDA